MENMHKFQFAGFNRYKKDRGTGLFLQTLDEELYAEYAKDKNQLNDLLNFFYGAAHNADFYGYPWMKIIADAVTTSEMGFQKFERDDDLKTRIFKCINRCDEKESTQLLKDCIYKKNNLLVVAIWEKRENTEPSLKNGTRKVMVAELRRRGVSCSSMQKEILVGIKQKIEANIELDGDIDRVLDLLDLDDLSSPEAKKHYVLTNIWEDFKILSLFLRNKRFNQDPTATFLDAVVHGFDFKISGYNLPKDEYINIVKVSLNDERVELDKKTNFGFGSTAVEICKKRNDVSDPKMVILIEAEITQRQLQILEKYINGERGGSLGFFKGEISPEKIEAAQHFKSFVKKEITAINLAHIKNLTTGDLGDIVAKFPEKYQKDLNNAERSLKLDINSNNIKDSAFNFQNNL